MSHCTSSASIIPRESPRARPSSIPTQPRAEPILGSQLLAAAVDHPHTGLNGGSRGMTVAVTAVEECAVLHQRIEIGASFGCDSCLVVTFNNRSLRQRQ